MQVYNFSNDFGLVQKKSFTTSPKWGAAYYILYITVFLRSDQVTLAGGVRGSLVETGRVAALHFRIAKNNLFRYLVDRTIISKLQI